MSEPIEIQVGIHIRINPDDEPDIEVSVGDVGFRPPADDDDDETEEGDDKCSLPHARRHRPGNVK